MRVIFLDIDGVLNSRNWMLTNHELIANCESMFERSCWQLDSAAVRRLSDFVLETGASVVISSSWRRLHPLNEINLMLVERGWLAPLPIDITPNSSTGFRGDEVAEWIVNCQEQIESHVIFDDDSDFHETQPLVRTHWDNGLQDDHIQQARNILMVNNV